MIGTSSSCFAGACGIFGPVNLDMLPEAGARATSELANLCLSFLPSTTTPTILPTTTQSHVLNDEFLPVL